MDTPPSTRTARTARDLLRSAHLHGIALADSGEVVGRLGVVTVAGPESTADRVKGAVGMSESTDLGGFTERFLEALAQHRHWGPRAVRDGPRLTAARGEALRRDGTGWGARVRSPARSRRDRAGPSRAPSARPVLARRRQSGEQQRRPGAPCPASSMDHRVFLACAGSVAQRRGPPADRVRGRWCCRRRPRCRPSRLCRRLHGSGPTELHVPRHHAARRGALRLDPVIQRRAAMPRPSRATLSRGW